MTYVNQTSNLTMDFLCYCIVLNLHTPFALYSWTPWTAEDVTDVKSVYCLLFKYVWMEITYYIFVYKVVQMTNVLIQNVSIWAKK